MGCMGLEAIPRNFHLHELPPDCQHSVLIHAHRQGVLNISDLQQAATVQCADTFIDIMARHKADNRSKIGNIGLRQTHPDKDNLVHPGLNQRFRDRKQLLLDKHMLSAEECVTVEADANAAMYDECKAAWNYITFFENLAINQKKHQAARNS